MAIRNQAADLADTRTPFIGTGRPPVLDAVPAPAGSTCGLSRARGAPDKTQLVPCGHDATVLVVVDRAWRSAGPPRLANALACRACAPPAAVNGRGRGDRR